MNLILIDPQEVAQEQVILEDRRREHIRKILRSQVGDTVRVGIVNGLLGRGVILELNRERVVLRLTLDTPPPPPPTTDLILALPRPIMLRRVLAQATTLGVGRIFLINAKRVEKSFFNASLLQEEFYKEFLYQGLEQAGDTRLPTVHLFQRVRPFVEDHLPELARACPLRLIAHPDTPAYLWEHAAPPLRQRVLLAIGPEGGWVDFELGQFQAQGFLPFTLGPRILRVDTALPALFAQLELLRQLPPLGGMTG